MYIPYAPAFVILNLIIYWEGSEDLTRTHEKKLNLYLYVSAKRAHPAGLLLTSTHYAADGMFIV